MIHNTPSKGALTLALYTNRCTTNSLMMNSNENTHLCSYYQFVILIILIQSTYNFYINYKPTLSE